MNTLKCIGNAKPQKILIVLNGSRLSSNTYSTLSKLRNSDSIVEGKLTTIDNDPKCHPDIIFDLRCSTKEDLAQTFGLFDVILSENTPLDVCTNNYFMKNIASLMSKDGIFAICVQRQWMHSMQPIQSNYPTILRNFYKEMRLNNELGKNILANHPFFGSFTKKPEILIFSKSTIKPMI